MKNFLRKFTPKFLISWYHFLWAVLGALLYGFPARNMTVIGVTGTNGKSTTVEMISRIFLEAGFKTASLSSIRFQVMEKVWRNRLKMTMPGRFVIQRFLRQAKNAACTHAVIEVTSEGILQHRHRFLNFQTAVFTNLSPEHIERHGSFEKYREAKEELFKVAKRAHVINADDPNAPYFLQFPAIQKYVYGTNPSKNSLLHSNILFAENIKAVQNGVRFRVKGKDLFIPLLGLFNVYNALAAICVAERFSISLDICKKALATIEGIPGRMEEVIAHPFRVIVDYAFTPTALKKVYKTLKNPAYRQAGTNCKLICVLGAAGGGRDKWKRPVLGKLAATYCDKVIVTNEDPYDESPEEIIEQVAKGAEDISINQRYPHESAVLKILDRREAIAKALSFAKPGDTVVITGKGCEDAIAVKGGKKIPWDDREVVREEFRQLDSQSNI